MTDRFNYLVGKFWLCDVGPIFVTRIDPENKFPIRFMPKTWDDDGFLAAKVVDHFELLSLEEAIRLGFPIHRIEPRDIVRLKNEKK